MKIQLVDFKIGDIVKMRHHSARSQWNRGTVRSVEKIRKFGEWKVQPRVALDGAGNPNGYIWDEVIPLGSGILSIAAIVFLLNSGLYYQ